jgi:hypothetical protein
MSGMGVSYEELKFCFEKCCKNPSMKLVWNEKTMLKSSYSIFQPPMMKEKAICPIKD